MENQVNIVHNEDCLDTMARGIQYDYVITSPPDFEEIGLKPNTNTNHINVWNYLNFLGRRLKFTPNHGLFTIFISDRRYEGKIISKQKILQDVINHYLLSHKIWVKSYKTNLYRPNFVHILTYGFDEHRATKPMPDVFYDEYHSVGKYRDNFSKDVVKKFITAYTNEGDVVYDPFMGSGTTALACIETNRKFIGSETNADTYKLCQERIDESLTARKMVTKEQLPSRPDKGSEKEVSWTNRFDLL